MSGRIPLAEIQRREALRETVLVEYAKELQLQAIREAMDRAKDVPLYEIVDAINEHLEATR